MENILSVGVIGVCIGIMEKKMETTGIIGLYRDYRGVCAACEAEHFPVGPRSGRSDRTGLTAPDVPAPLDGAILGILLFSGCQVCPQGVYLELCSLLCTLWGCIRSQE